MGRQPQPALCTAALKADVGTVDTARTRARCVSRFTPTPSTPGTDSNDFSTRRTQLARVMPMTWSLTPPGLLAAVTVEFMSLFRDILSERPNLHGSHRWKVKALPALP